MSFDLEQGAAVSPLHRFEYEKLLADCGLIDEGDCDYTTLLFDNYELAACGSLRKNVLKQIAVSAKAEGGGACAAVVSDLIRQAYTRGESKLFLYTKPQHLRLFASLGFYPLVETRDMLMMENERYGLDNFLHSIPAPSGLRGCIVCNTDPMTLGHLYLIETAARECDEVLVFVLSEDAARFPAELRFRFVREACAGIPNVKVYRSSDYMVSRATFPAYFLKEEIEPEKARSELDLTLFGKRIAPALGITRRYIGTEPFCPVTRSYNETMKSMLPQYGVEVHEIPRKDNISASRVRELIQQGRFDLTEQLLPPNVYEYCKDHFTGNA